MALKHIVFLSREVVPFYYGGIGTLFMSLAKFARDQGWKVFYLTQRRENFNLQKYEAYYEDIPVYFVDIENEDDFVEYSSSGGIINTYNLAYSFSVAETYERLTREFKPDIVFSADYGAEAFALLIKKFQGMFPETKFILHLSGSLHEVLKVYQGEHTFDELSEPRNKLVKLMEDRSLLLADEIISPSLSAWKQLSSRLKINKDRVRIIPNLLEKKFQERLTDNEVKFGKSNSRLILFVGRLDRHKGADLLLERYIEFCRVDNSDSKLMMVGRDCFCKEYGKTFLEEWEHKIPGVYRNKIEFSGQLDHSEVELYFQKATVCVFPSRWEVFGNVCLEAMVHGVPTMVSKGTGLSELLGDELEEYCFDFEREKGHFFSKLNDLISANKNDINLRYKFKKRATELIEKGEQGYQDFLENQLDVIREKISEDILRDLMEALSVMSDISGFLGNDLFKIKNYYELSDEDLKNIIQKGKGPVSKSFLGKLKSMIKA